MRSLLQRPVVALGAGLILGALLLLIVPSSWLFRDPPVEGVSGAPFVYDPNGDVFYLFSGSERSWYSRETWRLSP